MVAQITSWFHRRVDADLQKPKKKHALLNDGFNYYYSFVMNFLPKIFNKIERNFFSFN